MRVTQESDYAIRICCVLDEEDGLLDAETIADRVAITKSIALKVLRKLKAKSIVTSYQGAVGGYRLNCDSNSLTVYRIIEAIDGCVHISKCLDAEYICSKNGVNKQCCKMHLTFDAINQALVERLKSVTIREITDPKISISDITKKVK